MMRRALIAVAFSLFAAPAFSQTPELLAAAEQYVDTPAVQEIIRQSLSGPALANMVAEGFPANVQLSPEKMERIGNVLAEAAQPLLPKMREAMIYAAARQFTPEELNALMDFYNSEHGASVMQKMHPYLMDVMGRIAPEMAKLQQAALPKMIKELTAP